jgi:hypothetical protein
MADAQPIINAIEPAQNALDDAHAESIVTAFKALLAGLSPEKQERVRAELFKSFPANSAPRAGQVLGTILRLVPRDRPFTIEDVKKGIESEGIPATAKAIYNALGYLTRKEKITRIGHGRYVIDGLVWVTSDELGGAPSKDEEHDAN